MYLIQFARNDYINKFRLKISFRLKRCQFLIIRKLIRDSFFFFNSLYF